MSLTIQSDVFAIGSMRNALQRASRTPRSNAREEVFHIEEILHQIILQLDNTTTERAAAGEPQSPNRPKRDILNTALSNRSFLKPALDVLWRNMHSLTPFFHLLPHVPANDGKTKTITLTRFPIEDELPAFYKYARRLRSLALEFEKPDILPVSNLLIAILISPHRPTFPNLRTISLPHSHVTQAMAMTTIFTLSSPITSLAITALELETATFAEILHHFSHFFPDTLRHLNLTFPVEGCIFTMASLHPIPRFRALHSLTLSSASPDFPIFTPELMNWILNLEFLEVFELNIRAEPPAPALGTYRKRHAASACVRTLKLTGSLDVIYLILPMFAHCGAQVTELALTPVCPREDEVSFEYLMDYIRNSFPRAVLDWHIVQV